MKLENETKKPAYKEVLFGELEEGDVFEDDQGNVCMAICPVSCQRVKTINAIRLEDGNIFLFNNSEQVYPLEATLHYEKILEGE